MAEEQTVRSNRASTANKVGDVSAARRGQNGALLAWVTWAVVVALSLAGLALRLGDPATQSSIYALLNAILDALATIIYGLVGALILARRGRNVIGGLLLFIGVGLSLVNAVEAYLSPVVGIPPTPSLASYLYIWLSGWGWWLGMGPLFLILLLFPTGRLLSPRWRWVVYELAALFVIFMLYFALLSTWTDSNSARSLPGPFPLIPDSFPQQLFLVPWIAVLVLTAALCVSSVFIRYRRAAAIEREQLKWFLYACAVFILVYALAFFDRSSFRKDAWSGVFGAVLLLIPLSIGIAILRYRLWDIDVIIRGTVVYAPLTAILAGLFAVSIDLSKRFFLAFTGEQSEAATVLTTLIVVAAFDPVKTGLQKLVDQRFREAPDPEKRLRGFRDEVRKEMGVIDARRMTGRLLEEAMGAFGAMEGAVSLSDAEGRAVSLAMGDWKGHDEIRAALEFNGSEVGEISLGPRQNGLHYSEQDRAALVETANVVVKAIRGQGTGAAPSPQGLSPFSPGE